MQSLWGWLWVLALRHPLTASISAATAVLGTIYYSPKKMIEAWRWYVFEFRDRKVLAILEGDKRRFFGVPDISIRLRRREPSVLRSLNRLIGSKKVVRSRPGRYMAQP